MDQKNPFTDVAIAAAVFRSTRNTAAVHTYLKGASLALGWPLPRGGRRGRGRGRGRQVLSRRLAGSLDPRAVALPHNSLLPAVVAFLSLGILRRRVSVYAYRNMTRVQTNLTESMCVFSDACDAYSRNVCVLLVSFTVYLVQMNRILPGTTGSIGRVQSFAPLRKDVREGQRPQRHLALQPMPMPLAYVGFLQCTDSTETF